MNRFSPNEEFQKFLRDALEHEKPDNDFELLKMKIAFMAGAAAGLRFERELRYDPH